MFISVIFLPRKKCSFDACWSSFSVGILWPFSLFPGAEDTIAVWPNCWPTKPVGVRGVTVSSRILLSWNIDTFFMRQQCIMVIISQMCSIVKILLQCVSFPPPPPPVVPFPTLSSASPVRSSIAPAKKHYIIQFFMFRMHVLHTQTHWEKLNMRPDHPATMHRGSHSLQRHSTSVPVGGAPAPAANFPGVYAPHWGPRPSD